MNARRRALAGLLAALALTAARTAWSGPTSDDEFCSRVQQFLAGTTLVPDNHVYAEFADFRASKTVIRPLQTHQYVSREPERDGAPVRVSCKVKTPDHLNSAYGTGTAHDAGRTCRDVNRATAERVYADLASSGASLAFPLAQVAFDEDETTFMGSTWLEPYDLAYVEDGKVHIAAKALRVDWDNIWFSWAPERFRGAWYCHLVAPEYLRHLATGERKAARHTR